MALSRATLADVAKAVGLSQATVSRALNDHPDVSAKSRERVRQAAQDLGYRPSRTAQALRRGDFHAISAIVPDMVWGWWEPALRAAARSAAESGYHLLIHPIAGTKGGLEAIVESLANVPTEGVIVMTVSSQDRLREACERIGLAVIAIDDTSHEIYLPTVSVKNVDGARTVVEHLIDRGARTIACLAMPPEDFEEHWGEGQFAEERLAGYRQALAAHGLEVDERLILRQENPGDESTVTLKELDHLLASGPIPDAIFCMADSSAPPVMRTLSAHGLSVPDDVMVAGFDDERAALLVNPQLTTMRQPYEEIGRLAVDMLLKSLAGEVLPCERIELETTLVIRDSTGHGHGQAARTARR